MLNFGPSLPALSDPHESCYKPGTVKVAIYARGYVPVLVFYSQTIVIRMGIKYAKTGFFYRTCGGILCGFHLTAKLV